MIEQEGKKFYTMNEVSQMTSVHLITAYRRARTRDVNVIEHEGKKYLSEDSFGIIKKVGSPGRPPKKEVDKRVDMG
jgi:hypothetical protein